MITEDMNKAAEEYAWKELPDESSSGQFGTGDYFPPVDMEYPREIAIDAFKEGAKWQKEQMMKESVEHYVVGEIAGSPVGPAVVHYDESLNIGDKVRIIIVREEDK